MTFNGKSSFTALSAAVKMGDVVVGALQSIKIDDNYNTVRVGQVGTALDVAHIPGKIQVNVSARRIIVNYDLVNTFLRPAFSKTDLTGDITSGNVYAALKNQYGDMDKYGSSVYNQSQENKASENQYFNFYFDIDVSDQNGKSIFTIGKCSVATRNITFDQGAVVIAEDVTIFGRYMDFGSNQVII